MIEIDGNYLEGGGQILRTALSLSAITQKPCRIFNVSLATQHLIEARALSELCDGKLEGDKLGSQELIFYPAKIRSKTLTARIESAESITLVLQTLFLPCLFSQNPIKIIFKGGATDTFFSPTIDYFQFVFLKILEKIFSQKVAEVNIKKRGFYPEGGAEVEFEIFPAKIKPFNLTKKGEIKQITIISGASESLRKNKVAERQISGVREILSPKLKLPLKEIVEYYETLSPGNQINIVGDFADTIIGADNLGKLGKSAEEVGKEAAQNFFKQGNSPGSLDKNMADQILPFMALAGKTSKISVSEITHHCLTNIWVIEKFVDGKFEINPVRNEVANGVKENLITWL